MSSDRTILIISKNGTTLSADRDPLINNSVLFKEKINDNMNSITLEDIEIRRPQSKIKKEDLILNFDFIIKFCNQYKTGDLRFGPSYKKTLFDDELIGSDMKRVYNVINCAYALEFDRVVSLLSIHVASIIKTSNVKSFCDIFGVKDNFTEEQKESMRKELKEFDDSVSFIGKQFSGNYEFY